MSRDFLAQIRADSAIFQLNNAVNFARYEAMQRGQPVTLCASHDQQTCGSDWTQGFIIFARPPQQEKVLLRTYPRLKAGYLGLSAFPRHDQLKFLPAGLYQQQNGRFTYCPKKANKKFERALIISRAGRVRLEKKPAQSACSG